MQPFTRHCHCHCHCVPNNESADHHEKQLGLQCLALEKVEFNSD
jgi:hypothetical protein